MSADITLRPAAAEEAGPLGRIGFDAWNEGEHGALDRGRADRAKLLKQYVEFCARMAALIVVAERNGTVAGWGARERGDNYISDLWVAPAAQGRGIGGRLLAALETDIASSGFDTATLETRAGATRAIRFYEAHGYRIVWRKHKPTPALGYTIEKVGMEKPLRGSAL